MYIYIYVLRNFSDHYPIIATCRVLISACSHVVSDASAISDVTVFRWDHADLSSYYEYTGAWLQPVLARLNYFSDEVDRPNSQTSCVNDFVNDVYVKIVNVLLNAANLYVPRRKKIITNSGGMKK